MIKVRPIRTNEEVQLLIERAKADNHVVVGATHLMMKDGQIVGYFSIGGIPMVHNWCHSTEMTATDSLIALSQLEAIMAANGTNRFMMACDDESPFFEKMEKLGFDGLFSTNLFVKEV